MSSSWSFQMFQVQVEISANMTCVSRPSFCLLWLWCWEFRWIPDDDTSGTFSLYFAQPSYELERPGLKNWHLQLQTYCKSILDVIGNPFPVPSFCKLNHISICFIQISMKISYKQVIPFRESYFFEVIPGVLGCSVNFNITDFYQDSLCCQTIFPFLVGVENLLSAILSRLYWVEDFRYSKLIIQRMFILSRNFLQFCVV